MRTRFFNARIWDGHGEDYLQQTDVLVQDGVILSIGEAGPADESVDLNGRALLPGFIDAHFHAYAGGANLALVDQLPISYLAHHAAQMLGAALRRGFTTVRDAGGADWGLWKAVEDGLLEGPRIFYSGRAISQTGGHGDTRGAHLEPCSCRYIGQLSEVADGVDAIRRTARESLRRGAHQLKLFLSGGLSSPTDPIWMLQYSGAEIEAAVEEAASRRTYVMAHAYGADAIIRAVSHGVRSIEHGNLLDAEAAKAMARHAAFLVPTLITYEALRVEGPSLGLPEVSMRKLGEVAEQGGEAVRLARAAGARIGFGSDLLGAMHVHQSHEFRLRGAVEEPVDVLRSATSVNAALIQREGRLGCVRPGALADFAVVDGDPLSDLSCLYAQEPERVYKAGVQVAG